MTLETVSSKQIINASNACDVTVLSLQEQVSYYKNYVEDLKSQLTFERDKRKELDERVIEMEKQLIQSSSRFDRLLHSNMIGIVESDIYGRIISANEAFLSMLGYAEEDLPLRWDTMTPSEWMKEDEFCQEKLRLNGSYGPWKKEYYHKNGTRIPVLIGVTLLRATEGNCVCFIIDLSELDEVSKKAKDLENKEKLKSIFFANISHELKTPLNSIHVLSNLLSKNRMGNLTDKQVEDLDVIHNSSHELLGLINSILDLTKMSAGTFNLNLAPVNLQALLDGLEKKFHPLAQLKGLIFTLHVEDSVSSVIESDAVRLNQILINIISNAVKYTDNGSVALTLNGFEDEELNEWVCFSVQDTGIGIPRDRFDAIFETFEREDIAVNRKYGGAGLGLSISKELCDRMGGKIEVQSRIGEGSCFRVTLPVSNLN